MIFTPMVSIGVSLDNNTAAADYIKLYNGDNKTLTESLSVIQETSAKILDEILPQERHTPFVHRPESTSRTVPECPRLSPQPRVSMAAD